METLTHLTNKTLLEELRSLCAKEKEITSEVVRYLHEVDSRRLYLYMGYPSLFAYVTEGLNYSESAAYRRIQAARCCTKHPEIYEKLKSGALSLSAVSEISRVITDENKEELLSQAEGKSKVELLAITAPYKPIEEKNRRESVRSHKIVEEAMPLFQGASTSAAEVDTKTSFTITLEVDQEFMELLTKAKALMGAPTRGDAIKRSLKRWISKNSPTERVVRREIKKTASKIMVSRQIPVAVRDQVYMRDKGRCSYLSPDGHQCSSTHGLHIDHIYPFSMGGAHEVENLRLLCPSHNQFFRRKAFGDDSFDYWK